MAFLFETDRLGFRPWHKDDLNALHLINSDPEVMKFFPEIKTKDETFNFIKRMQKQFEKRQYCYFATIYKKSDKLIGFVGLSYQDYIADFNPSVDIGWRLSKDFWGKGIATEGAKANLDYAFNILNLTKIVSVAPTINLASITVMKKIGMSFKYTFDHPALLEYPHIKNCSLYVCANTYK